MNTVYQTAENLANQVTTFFCSAACPGAPKLGSLEEFSLLVEWNEAATAAQALAVSQRSWLDVKDYDAMVDESNMWLDHWQKTAH